MSPFVRADIPSDALCPRALAAQAERLAALRYEYADYRTIPTGVSAYSAAAVITGLDLALGGRIASLLLTVDAETTLCMGAQVMADHAHAIGSAKDAQLGLMVNIIKEIAHNQAHHAAQHFQIAEDVIRRCSLDPDMKLRLREELFDKSAISSSRLVQICPGLPV